MWQQKQEQQVLVQCSGNSRLAWYKVRKMMGGVKQASQPAKHLPARIHSACFFNSGSGELKIARKNLRR